MTRHDPGGRRTRRAVGRVLAPVLMSALVGVLLVGSGTAGAHAALVRVDPADGSRLAEAPEHVELEFTEDVSVRLGGVEVRDERGAHVERGVARASGHRVEVALAGGLGPGSYVVTYRVVSADGHPVRGASVFTVGTASADAGDLAALRSRFDDPDGDRPWAMAAGVAAAVAYAGCLLAAGGAVFLVVVLRGGPDRARLSRLVTAGALAGAVGLLAGLPLEAARATGSGLGALGEPGVARAVAGDGRGWAVVLGVAGVAGLVAALRPRRSRPAARRTVGVAGVTVAAVTVAVSFSLTGHSRATSPAALVIAADAAHVLAAAVWTGGLVLAWRALSRSAAAEPAGRADVVTRFSGLAGAALAVLAAAGAVLGWAEIRTADALTSTTYGTVLLVKLALVAAVLAVALHNRRRLVPAVRGEQRPAALSRLGRTLGLELAGVVAVVAVTAVLVQVTPARVAARVGGGVIETSVALGDRGSVDVVVDPARVGINTVHLYLLDRAGRPAPLGDEVVVTLALPPAGIGPIRRTPVQAGPSHYSLDALEIPVPGTWTLEVGVRVDRFDQAVGSTEIEVVP